MHLFRRSAALLFFLPWFTLTACNMTGGASGAPDLSGPSLSEETVASLVRMGDYAFERGETSSAIGLYRRAHSAAPDDPEPLQRLALALSRTGAYEEAAGAYRTLLELEPENSEAERGLGNALIYQGLPEEAVPHLQSALADQGDWRAHNSMGVALDLLGRHGEAQGQYRQGLAGAPNDLDIRTNLALSLSLAGEHEEAIEVMREIATVPAATMRHRQTLALIYGLAARPQDAARVARLDLEEADVVRALRRYEELRAIEDSGLRAAAIVAANRGLTTTS